MNFLLFISMFLAAAFAQDNLEPQIKNQEITESELAQIKFDNFRAIVQFAEGNPFIVENFRKRKNLEFKEVLLPNNTLVVPDKKNSKIKLILASRCIVVFYENTKAVSPEKTEEPWRILQGSSRWICPEGKKQAVKYKETEILIDGGEVLISKNRLVTLKPKVSQKDKELFIENMYLYKDGRWMYAKKQKNEYDLFHYDRSFPIPQESIRKDVSKPLDPKVKRLFAAVIPYGYGFFAHHEKDTLFSDYAQEAYGIKIGTNFLWRKNSIITFLELGGSENSDSKKDFDGNSLPKNYQSLEVNYSLLALGLRHKHKSSSSYYYFTGLGLQKIKFGNQIEENRGYFGELSYDYNLVLGGGFQKIYFQKNWLSMIVGVEAKILQSLHQGQKNHYNQGFDLKDVDPRSTSTYGLIHIYLGPQFNF